MTEWWRQKVTAPLATFEQINLGWLASTVQREQFSFVINVIMPELFVSHDQKFQNHQLFCTSQEVFIWHIRLCGWFQLCTSPGTSLLGEWPLAVLTAVHREWWNSIFCGWPLQQTGPVEAGVCVWGGWQRKTRFTHTVYQCQQYNSSLLFAETDWFRGVLFS